MHVETYPNEHETIHMLATEEKSRSKEDGVSGVFQKTLMAAGITCCHHSGLCRLRYHGTRQQG